MAEPTLLDLLDGLVDWMRDSPLLVVCTARPDIFERREGWGGRPGATTLSLRPLARADVDRLIENLINHPTLDEDAKQRIAAAAEGNPLFVEQLLAMLIDEGLLQREGDTWSLVGDFGGARSRRPCTRCSRRGSTAYHPTSAGSTGVASAHRRTFGPAGVADLLHDDVSHADIVIRELVRKDLVRPERTPDGEVFRFRHVLILQAAYEMLPKRRRAELHEAVAGRLGDAAAYDELAGITSRARRAHSPTSARIPTRWPRFEGTPRRAWQQARTERSPVATCPRPRAVRHRRRVDPADDPGRLSMLPELGIRHSSISAALDDARSLSLARARSLRSHSLAVALARSLGHALSLSRSLSVAQRGPGETTTPADPSNAPNN